LKMMMKMIFPRALAVALLLTALMMLGRPDSGEAANVLQSIRGARDKNGASIVFQFREKIQLEEPAAEGGKLAITFPEVTTQLSSYRVYKTFSSFVKLRQDGNDLNVLIGIPRNLEKYTYTQLDQPNRLVFRFTKEETAPQAAPETIEPAKSPSEERLLPDKLSPPAVEAANATGSAGLVSLSFNESDIREILLALAMKQNANIIMAQDAVGKVSIHLNRVPLDEAVASIAMAGGCSYRKEKGIYFVYKTKEVRDPQSDRLQIKVFKLKFLKIDGVQNILSALPGVKTVKIHDDSKSVIVEDTPENIAKIASVLAAWDTTPRQVLIEAQILQVSLTDAMHMGVDWKKLIGTVTFGTAGALVAQSPAALPGGANTIAQITAGVGSAGEFQAAISALQTLTKVDTLSRPKILAVHGKPAKVQVGGKRGYRIVTANLGVTQESIQFLDEGTTLEITPLIDDNGNIQLEVKPTIASTSVDKGAVGQSDVPNQALQTISTTLVAKNGQTIFIGGLIQDTATSSRSMIPWLGKIPFLGWLFGQSNPSIGKTELVVLITPQILDMDIQKTSAAAEEKTQQAQENLEGQTESVYKRLLKDAIP
jgi:type II secretory pathway component GspD/PulD (secretin)